jgi:choline dehydrogenase-like flavoprotein
VRCAAAVFELADLYDAVVIGSGFGGSMAAHALVRAGQSVLMLERGDWVSRGPHNWMPGGAGLITSHYSMEAPYRVLDPAGDRELGAFHCVGGPSVFYGGVSLRFRVEDFEHDPEIAEASDARWPFAYRDLEPYYAEVERILGVAGETGGDPTEPPRSTPFPQAPAVLSPTSCLIADACRQLALKPFRLPLAINYSAGTRNRCIACGTCDGYACAITAKNDLATTVIDPLLRDGLELRTNTVVTRLVTDGSRITAVEWADRVSGRKGLSRGRRIVLGAGALASPHLLLASRLQRLNPGGHTVGRFLMRHYAEAIFGAWRHQLDPADRFHKQLGIHDFYFGDSSRRRPRGKLGGIQQLATPGQALVRRHLPRLLGSACVPCLSRLIGLLIIAEDQPQYENRVALDPGATDRFGVPRLLISHRYTSRDLAAGRTLASRAKEILRRTGALACYRHRIGTFSHAVGTVRMGTDPRTSALDPDCRFRGVENLYVVDGSVMPTSGGVNPSLTIAANALRATEQMLRTGAQNRRSHQHDLIRC